MGNLILAFLVTLLLAAPARPATQIAVGTDFGQAIPPTGWAS